MITRLSIAFEDFPCSSIASQVMPPWCVTIYIDEFISSHFIIDLWRSLKSQYRDLFEPAGRPKLELDFRINQFARWPHGHWAG